MAWWDSLFGEGGAPAGAGADPAAADALTRAQNLPPYYLAAPGQPYQVGTGGPEDILTAAGLPLESGQAGGASGNGLGQMSALSRFANLLGGTGTPGAAPRPTPAGGTTPATPAASNIAWDNTAPDAFAQTERDKRQWDQWDNLAGDVGKWIRTAALAGAA